MFLDANCRFFFKFAVVLQICLHIQTLLTGMNVYVRSLCTASDLDAITSLKHIIRVFCFFAPSQDGYDAYLNASWKFEGITYCSEAFAANHYESYFYAF